MCGIIAYCGPERRSLPHDLVRHLAALEYRGYDSAGVLSLAPSGFSVTKTTGSVAQLVERLRPKTVPAAEVGMAHTRWATHGAVTEANAHPLVSPDGELALVMNGVVENDVALRATLAHSGSDFASDGDAATVLTLIAAHLKKPGSNSLSVAAATAFGEADGRLTFCVASRASPDTLVVARRGSPIFIGRAGSAAWVASDPVAFPETVDKVFELKDGEIIAVVRGQIQERDQPKLTAVVPVRRYVRAERGDHGSFFEKETYEQEASIARVVEAALELGSLPEPAGSLWSRVVLLGCGSAHHACLAAKRSFERWTRLPTEAWLANEFVDADPVINAETLVIAVSQSGETADTLAAAAKAKTAGGAVIAVTNAPNSTLARLARNTCDLAAGPEVSVASTKAYTAMLIRLTFLAAECGVRNKAMSAADFRLVADGAHHLVTAIPAALATRDAVIAAATRWREREAFLFMGRGFDHTTALEGALKLKELSYRHADGVAAGELKHGTIALIAQGYPVVAVAVDPRSRAKMAASIREVQARGAAVLAVVSADDREIRSVAEDSIEVPLVRAEWAPVVAALPLQWLALHIAQELGRNIDRPRNLAKSVTVV